MPSWLPSPSPPPYAPLSFSFTTTVTVDKSVASSPTITAGNLTSAIVGAVPASHSELPAPQVVATVHRTLTLTALFNASLATPAQFAIALEAQLCKGAEGACLVTVHRHESNRCSPPCEPNWQVCKSNKPNAAHSARWDALALVLD